MGAVCPRVYVDWGISYRWLIQHSTSLPHSVLTGVQVQSLVLQDLPLSHDVLHLSLQEPGEGGDHPLVTSSDVFLLQQAQPGTRWVKRTNSVIQSPPSFFACISLVLYGIRAPITDPWTSTNEYGEYCSVVRRNDISCQNILAATY